MELETTLNPFVLPSDQGMEPYYDDLKNYRDLGFPTLDFIFCNADWPGSPMLTDHWADWVKRMAEKAQELGITFAQSHLPYYNFSPSGGGLDADKEELVRRSLIAASILGAKWTVTHPATDFNRYDMVAASRQCNLDYVKRYVELGEKYGVGIAVENMADFPGQGYKRSYGALVEELCDLVDTIGSSKVGVCWDFGHANLVYRDQPSCLRTLGSRLKALHVHDNHGTNDEHLPPFFGNVDWAPIMRTLVEIGYPGPFSFEIKRINFHLPKHMRNAQWQYAKTAGDYLLTLCR